MRSNLTYVYHIAFQIDNLTSQSKSCRDISMKHIIKLTILLITFTLVSCGEKPFMNKQSSQPKQTTSIAWQSGTPLNPFALNRLAKQIVVEIVSKSYLTEGDKYDKYIPKGSGVIISRKDSTYYVLTANHISDIDDGLSVFIRSEKPGEAGEILPLKFIKRYPRKDLAVVAFASVTDYMVAEVGEASQLNNNSQVYVTGWPGNDNRQGFQFTPAQVTNPRARDNLTYQPTQPDEGVYKGMSGGAVLNEAGQLVGIHVGLTKAGGDGKGVLISTFLQMIRENVTLSQTQYAEIYFRQGFDRYKQGEYQKALADYNQAIRLNPKLAVAYFYRSLVYRKQGEYEKALAELNQVIRLNPKFALAYAVRGTIYSQQGEYEKALAEINQAIQLDPKLAVAYNNRGWTYYNQGKHKKALTDYNQAIQLDPELADAYNNRGWTYYNQGKYEKALADYNQATQLNPKFAAAYNNRGIVYKNQQEYEKALAGYNQAIRLNPKFAIVYYNRGMIYKLNKNIEKAISDFEKAADLYKQQANQQLYQESVDQLKELRGY